MQGPVHLIGSSIGSWRFDGAPTAGAYQDTPTILSEVGRMNQTRKIKIHTIGFHLSPAAEELMRSGLGPAKAASLLAAVEIGGRLARAELPSGER